MQWLGLQQEEKKDVPIVVKARKNAQALGNSLVVQWLGLGASTEGAGVQFLVRELRYHKPHSAKQTNRNL